MSSGRLSTVGGRGARQVQPGHEPRRRGGARGVDREVEGHLRRRGVDADLGQPGRRRHPAPCPCRTAGRRAASRSRVRCGPGSRPFATVGAGSSVGRPVVQQVDVGVDAFLGRLAQAQDPQRDPRVVGRDRDVDGRPVADRLAALGGGIGVEDRGEEDRRSGGVELEDLGRVRREPEAVVLRPAADFGRTAAQDGHVEGVDADLHELLGGAGGRRPARRRRTGTAAARSPG